MQKEGSQNIKIPSWVQSILKKREILIKEQESEINKIQENGVVRQQDIAKISRRSSSIESFDTKLSRRGFFPPQRIQPTSKTTQIFANQLQFEQSSGFNISPRRGGGGGTTTKDIQPWDLIIRSGGTKIDVSAGTINGFLPTNWNIDGGGRNVSVNNSSIYYAKAIVFTDGQETTNVNILIDTNPPQTQEAKEFGIDTKIEILFGIFYEGVAYRTIGDGNINASPKLWLTTKPVTPPNIGEVPFTQYFFFR
jgi:hypothetical protein